MIVMGEIFIVNGQRVELPASTGAMLGFQRAPDIANTTPFVLTSPTLNLRRGLTGGVNPDAAADAACRGLQARIEKYGALDPNPAVRKALLEKCETYQRTQQTGVTATNPDEYPGDRGLGGLDTKTKIAIGVGALVLGAIVLKKMKKR